MSSFDHSVPAELNGKPVVQETLIQDGGTISMGTCNFRFEYRKNVNFTLHENTKRTPPRKVRLR